MPGGLPQAGAAGGGAGHGPVAGMVEKIHGVHRHVTIALVGKYTGLHDAYLSVVESLFHAGTACDAEVSIRWVDSETLTPEKRGADAGRVRRRAGPPEASEIGASRG